MHCSTPDISLVPNKGSRSTVCSLLVFFWAAAGGSRAGGMSRARLQQGGRETPPPPPPPPGQLCKTYHREAGTDIEDQPHAK